MSRRAADLLLLRVMHEDLAFMTPIHLLHPIRISRLQAR